MAPQIGADAFTQCPIDGGVAAHRLDEFARDEALHAEGMDLCFAEMKGPVKDRLKRYGLFTTLGTDNFFPHWGKRLIAIWPCIRSSGRIGMRSAAKRPCVSDARRGRIGYQRTRIDPTRQIVIEGQV